MIGKEVQGIVEKVVFRGKGLLRIDGWVIFVDNVIEQEEVRVRITAKKKSYFESELIEVVVPSPYRRSSRCSHFGRCAGCQLQHMSYDAQKVLKGQWIQELFTHKNHFEGPYTVIGADHEFAYRRKVAFHFVKTSEASKFGYIGKDNSSLFPVTECPIIRDDTTFIASLRAFLAQQIKMVKGQVTALWVGEKQFLVHIRVSEGALTSLFLPEGWLGCTIEQQGKKQEIGQQTVQETFLGVSTHLSCRTFVQNYPEMSAKLYGDVVDRCDGPVLDLYAGIGLTAALLAKKGLPVTAVELNPHSKTLFTAMKVEGVDFVSSSVEAFLQRPHKKLADTWILNPPRTGLTESVIQSIQRYKPKKLLYISCMPQALQRDIDMPSRNSTRRHMHDSKKFRYQIKEIHTYDMFPQTAHVEMMAHLQRD